MLRCHKFFLILLFLTIAAVPRPCRAATIPTYDLDSLCFMSTDIVEATVSWHHTPGQKLWQDRLTAIVDNSIVGQYHSGDEIPARDLDLYNPLVNQRCILFIQRRQFTFYLQPSEAITPRVTDMLLIDRLNHVRRYFQWMGGLLAEGYSIPDNMHTTEEDSAEQSYPTLADERKTIATKWAAVDQLRLLLSHDPRPEDVPVLFSLLRVRQNSHKNLNRNLLPYNDWADGIAKTICSRLADLGDPTVALDALSLNLDYRAKEESGLEEIAFHSASGLAYARSVAGDMSESAARRAAAAEVISINSR